MIRDWFTSHMMIPGYLVTWLPGYLVTWLPGYLVTSFIPMLSLQVIPYSVDGYISLGRNVAKTFLNYYQLTPTPPTANQLIPPVNKSKLRAHIRDEVLMVHRQRNNTSK